MAYKIAYSPPAKGDLDEAYYFYKQISKTVLQKFRAKVKKTEKMLKLNPFF